VAIVGVLEPVRYESVPVRRVQTRCCGAWRVSAVAVRHAKVCGLLNTYDLVAGLSWLPGTAASAALKPVREWVPSQNGLVVEPPHLHRANGRLGIV
jgi:hypothetical protein